MIDHETARRSFATSLDFALEPDEREALDAHLHDCPACRSFAAAARSDAATLRELDFGPVPVAVRANVAIAAEHTRRGGALGRWVALVAVGAILLVAVGGGALGAGAGRGGNGEPGATQDPGAVAAQIEWKTGVVALAARAFTIEAGGKTFRASVPSVDVHSDPGNATYRTLEATWRENGVEMRLNLYFKSDATAWWVDEIRIYDGTAKPEWLTARGTFFKTPLGATWTGDQDVTMGGSGRVRFGGLTLASRAFDGINEPIGGGVPLPAGARPFAPGGVLHCSGILQMTPQAAQSTLLSLGYRLSWRLVRTTGPNTGYADIFREAPLGVIFQEPFAGDGGELIVFVAPAGDPKAVALPFPDDCPRADPNRTPPPPAP